MVSNTGSRLPGVLEITFSTSDVASLLFERVSKELSRLGEFSGLLVKLVLEVGSGGNATARSCLAPCGASASSSYDGAFS